MIIVNRLIDYHSTLGQFTTGYAIWRYGYPRSTQVENREAILRGVEEVRETVLARVHAIGVESVFTDRIIILGGDRP
jgi:hypothetical protein